MSQGPRPHIGNISDGGVVGTGPGDRYPPQSTQSQTSQGESNFSDGSGALFTMYNEMSEEEDKKMAESWKADADGILVFTGLFSAAVAALVAVTIQDLRPNSQDTSAFYLQNIYQLLADPNRTNVSIPPALANPPPFSPPSYAVWVNSLWFLSLAISLSCGLLATLLQQWARRYIKITQTRYSPHKRARIRAFFAEGVEKLHLPWAVEALPTLLHLSLFIFFAGLLIFLFNVHYTVFTAVVWWIGFCTAIYGCVTLMPIFRHDSPYYAPLSSPAWLLINSAVFAVVQSLRWFDDLIDCLDFTLRDRVIDLGRLSLSRAVEGMGKTAEKTALEISSKIDARALKWTFDSLDEDNELERFFAGIPGFCISNMVSNPRALFIRPNKRGLSEALIGLIQRTLTSNLISQSGRRRRTLICTDAMHTAALRIDPSICQRIFDGEWDGLLKFVEFGHFIRRDHYNDPYQAYYSTCMVAAVIARVKKRDDRWSELAIGHLGVSAPIFQNYLAHGDSALLANLNHLLWHIIRVYFKHINLKDIDTLRKTLEFVSKFNIRNTLPVLQCGFCDIWNEIVVQARNATDFTSRSLLILILKSLRKAYLALHEGTDSAPRAFAASTDVVVLLASSFPLCWISDHRPHHASHAQAQDADTEVTDLTFPPVQQDIVSPWSTSSPSPTDDIAIVGPSWLYRDPEQLGNQPSHPSHSGSTGRI